MEDEDKREREKSDEAEQEDGEVVAQGEEGGSAEGSLKQESEVNIDITAEGDEVYLY